MFRKFLSVGLWIVMWNMVAEARPNLVISDIQIGYEDNKTRIALILSQPVNLYARLAPDSNSVIIESPEDTIWEIPPSVEQSQGGFEKYQLNEITDTPRTLTISCKPVTTLAGHEVQTTPSGQHQFVIDLVTEEPLPPEPEPEPEEPENIPPEQPPVTSIVVNNPVVEVWPPAPNKIKGIKVSEQKDGVTWASITSAFREYFKFDVLPEKKKILIYLPKTNWLEVDTRLKSSPLVRTYRVQDTDPNFSVICLETYQQAWVIDQFMSPNSDGTNDFVVIIASRPPTAEEQARMKEKQTAETLQTRRDQQLMMQEKFKEALVPQNPPLVDGSPLPPAEVFTPASSPVEAAPPSDLSSDQNLSANNLTPVDQTAPPHTSTLSSGSSLFDSDMVSVGSTDATPVPLMTTSDTQTTEPAWVMQARKAAEQERNQQT